MFGSVALKAYLPDGDIDFALLGRDAAEPEGRRPLREMWTQCLADVFTRERQSPQTQLRIGEVQVINAEVWRPAVYPVSRAIAWRRVTFAPASVHVPAQASQYLRKAWHLHCRLT